ncbi:MAG: class I SAM-dependent methyltransferase [Candidatus Bathyarchaeota archaeon]|nr:class I SAM-dependent methyltransferase [Candidatus Bathyarchaeota archaeon]MDH5595138.1 class I SAM-dependent methyltransferase [Candidatus Bathyarchaeota archaeon]
MGRLIAFLMFHLRAREPMLKILKRQIRGLTYLLSHPLQLKRIIIRETRYGQRHRSKRKWVEWQKYDTCTAAAQHSTAVARARPLNVERMQTISDMVSRVGNGLRVLDVGCGDGAISEYLWKMGNHVTSVDLKNIATIAHRCRVLLVVAGDAEQLAFASNSFDVVLASEVVEHLWNPHSFLDEAHRVLRANGHLIISTPEGREGLRYDSHKYYFTVEGLKQMLGAKFTLREVKRLKPIGAPTSTIILLLRKSMIKRN